MQWIKDHSPPDHRPDTALLPPTRRAAHTAGCGRWPPLLPGTTSSEPLLLSCLRQEGRLPLSVCKGFPTFRNMGRGTSLGVQWLRLCAPSASEHLLCGVGREASYHVVRTIKQLQEEARMVRNRGLLLKLAWN